MIDAQTADRLRRARQLCLFAHYDPDGIVADHVLRYLDAIAHAGFTVLVISTADPDAATEETLVSQGHLLARRANHGLDFGGWIEACTALFPIAAELLLLANDSVYAPIGEFTAFVERLVAHDADYYGAVESAQFGVHLQSWFLLLRPSAYRSAAFAALMTTPMPTLPDKAALIERYEVGLSRSLAAAGLRGHAAFTSLGHGAIAVAHPYNPAHLLWRDMLRAGVPFIKVELLRFNPLRAGDLGQWRTEVRDRAPALEAMIDRDLARRGTVPAPGWWAMSEAAPVYWPELRPLLLADHRGGAGGGRTVRRLAFRALRGLAWYPRRLHGKLRGRRRAATGG